MVPVVGECLYLGANLNTCEQASVSVATAAKLGDLTGLLFGIARNTHHGRTQQPVSDLVSAL